MSDPTPDYASAWADLSGYVDKAVEDGQPIDAKVLAAYMQQLRRKALAPPRNWRAGIIARRIAEPPRNPCPSGRHHAHPGLTCDQYEQWRVDIDAAIKPKEQP